MGSDILNLLQSLKNIENKNIWQLYTRTYSLIADTTRNIMYKGLIFTQFMPARLLIMLLAKLNSESASAFSLTNSNALQNILMFPLVFRYGLS